MKLSELSYAARVAMDKKYKRFARKKAKGIANITGEQRVAWVKEFMVKHKLEE